MEPVYKLLDYDTISTNIFQDNAGKGDSLDQGSNGEVLKQEIAKILNRLVHKIFSLHYVMHIVFLTEHIQKV